MHTHMINVFTLKFKTQISYVVLFKDENCTLKAL